MNLLFSIGMMTQPTSHIQHPPGFPSGPSQQPLPQHVPGSMVQGLPPQHVLQQPQQQQPGLPPQQIGMVQQQQPMLGQFTQNQPPPPQFQQQQQQPPQQNSGEAPTAELISFD